jgi:hypothetical protein
MEHLPRIDEHHKRVGATPERTWEAVVEFARGRLGRPAPAAFASAPPLK